MANSSWVTLGRYRVRDCRPRFDHELLTNKFPPGALLRGALSNFYCAYRTAALQYLAKLTGNLAN